MHHHALLIPEKGLQTEVAGSSSFNASLRRRGCRGSIHTLDICECVLSAHRPIDRASTGFLDPQLRGEINLRRQGGLILCPPNYQCGIASAVTAGRCRKPLASPGAAVCADDPITPAGACFAAGELEIGFAN